MWPIHAGMAANDSLVILDEAHCANPFRQSIERVRKYRLWTTGASSILTSPFYLTLLSATLPPGIEAPFMASDEDMGHAVLGTRIGCAKPAKLVQVRVARNADSTTQWAERIAQEATKLVSEDRRAIGVIVNRVATAKGVHHVLDRLGKESVLLTGRMRPIDHDYATRSVDDLKTGHDRGQEQVRFVVATQTLEVGADLDFDALVTECASLDALRQRFGRLNRGGRPIASRAVVMIRSNQLSSRSRIDPIYGEALPETWEWLKDQSKDGEIDLGYEALEKLLPLSGTERQDLLRRLSAPAPDAPVMLPAHIDAWVQTSPTPDPDPDVSIFLHGPELGAPDVQVCWRSDLRQDMTLEMQRDIVSLCPPVSAECIPVPLPLLRSWLGGENRAENLSDLAAGSAEDADRQDGPARTNRWVLCWRGPSESMLVGYGNQLRPGDTVVIPVELGGWDVFGHIPSRQAGGGLAIDVGDEAHLLSRSFALLRVNEKALESWPECSERAALLNMAGRDDIPEDDEEVQRLLEQAVASSDTQAWLRSAAQAWCQSPKSRRKLLPHPGGGFVLRSHFRVSRDDARLSTPTDEDDAFSSTVEVPLERHLEGVARWTARFCHGVGLPARLKHDLELAARFHDFGKADPRFQALLHGGSPWAARAAGVLLAKSAEMPASRREYLRAGRDSGFPTGGRHELLSVRLVESVGPLLESAHDPDLVLHLVSSHHGRCRPFAPVVNDPDPIQVDEAVLGYPLSACSSTGLERLDSGVPERFWRLVRRHGWWGLAWLEALVRVADHRCSEEEQNTRNARGPGQEGMGP